MRLSARALAAVITTAVVLLAACGDDQTAAPELSPIAEQGRQVAAQNGCASCHGANGQGGVGPAFVGLVGSERTFADGTSLVADEAYVRESILEPAARQVADYSIIMPENDLSPEEVDQVVAYILELSNPPEPAS
ncbi:MAG: cytochrome c [Ilumatobacteraceae bacterium]|jgi:cytochrome c oxidase subunit 2|nr:cytochrome c [Ilumatobacteraceae bacterium]